ncbi:hypothetical protein [Curtobacterium pusillum]|uniref:hypothetical protein n=1 Tax=Curtobacterium pusillum TaxID=69373 RepID=UPI0011A1469C|nr:hypothetical protein [Curtobacterium pusillum]
MVSPYRKPLSIVAGGSVKDQRPPTMLAGGPQQLDALVLLDRVETGEVTATRLDLVDSMAALVPHTSGLSSLPRPLHRLARLIADCGGAIRLRYSEAAEVDLATVIARCAKRTLPWSDVVDDMQDDRAQAPSGAMVRAEYTDAIEAGGDLTVFAGDRLLRLSPVAATVWRLCAIATTPDAIAPKLGLAPDIVREVASELIDRDLLRYAARVEPDRSGPTPPLPPC